MSEHSNTYMPPEYQVKHLHEGFAEERQGFIHPSETGSLTPCSVDKNRVCNYPHSCCMKKIRSVKLVKLEEVSDVIEQMTQAVQHAPQAGWNVCHWNKALPDSAICFGYETETQAIRAFNTVTKMTSTLAACLRWQTSVKEGYVWML